MGPPLGYYPNAKKTVVVVKKEFEDKARHIFAGMDVQITSHGQRHLGAALGCPEFRKEYVEKKVLERVEELQRLVEVAGRFPHSAHAAFTKGFKSKWTYLLRTQRSTTCLTLSNESSQNV